MMAWFVFFWLLGLAHINSATPKACSKGWQKFGNRCFHFGGGEIITKWNDGEAKCEDLHPTAHLASIHSKQEQEFIAGKIKIASYFGASDLAKEGEWTWSDGSVWDYANWMRSEPNG